MKQLPEFPDRYWLKFSQDPVDIKSYDSRTKNVAKKYIAKLCKLTSNFGIETIYHRGSTSLGISGKGDIEIGLIPENDYWFEVIVHLANYYKGLGNLDEDYCRFNDVMDGFEIEIILMKGYTAKLDLKLHKHLVDNQELLKEYELIKRKFSFSNREYNRNKDKFFRKIIKSIRD